MIDDEDDGIGIEMGEINKIPSTAIVIDSEDENESAVTPKNIKNNTSNKKFDKKEEKNVDHSNEKTGLISAEEKNEEDVEKNNKKNKEKKKKEKKEKKEIKEPKKLTRHNSEPIPWCKLFTNPAAIIIYLLAGAGDWNFYTLMTYSPTFIKGMYDISISTTTILIFFPFLSETIFQLILCPVGDYLIDHKYMSYILL